MEVLYGPSFSLHPSWNVAPTQQSPVICLDEKGEAVLREMVWGFTPEWFDRGRPGPINARCETTASNGVFRSAFRERRCLLPVSGFYEWKQTGLGKQPHYIHPLNEKLFFLAGLWEPGKKKSTFAVLTTTPNELMAKIHDRMPVIVRADRTRAWLESSHEDTIFYEPYPAEEMGAFVVSPRVNHPREDDPRLLEPAEPERGLFGD